MLVVFRENTPGIIIDKPMESLKKAAFFIIRILRSTDLCHHMVSLGHNELTVFDVFIFLLQ